MKKIKNFINKIKYKIYLYYKMKAIDSAYCNKCGSCGMIDCCPPCLECLKGKGKYCESNFKELLTFWKEHNE